MQQTEQVAGVAQEHEARPVILIVDDEESVRESFALILNNEYTLEMASTGYEALKRVEASPPAAVFLDIRMPGISGIETLRRLRELDSTMEVIFVTAVDSVSTAIAAMRLGAFDYLIKPFHRDEVILTARRALEKRRLVLENREYQETLELRVAARTRELEKKNEEIRHLYLSAIEMLICMLEAKNKYTEEHSRRVAQHSQRLARRLGLPEPEVENVRLTGLLHDIGKIGIRDEVLNKPAKLTPEEYAHIKSHTMFAEHILRRLPGLGEVTLAVKHDHERYDGRGYPDGLSGEQIPWPSRVVAIADAYDAMISARPYRAPLPREVALQELRANAGTQFDPYLAQTFVKMIEEEG
ncbi:MAG: response regulator [Deltaproteobacteria bacterium]|nr:response regulator [Deltaproteobacteria bacterium]